MAVVHDRILIEKKNIPYRFSIALPRVLYELEIRYNESADIFVISLYKGGELLCTEPILYGRQMFIRPYRPPDYPALIIIPNDPSAEASRVTWDNFGETVFLEIYNTEDD